MNNLQRNGLEISEENSNPTLSLQSTTLQEEEIGNENDPQCPICLSPITDPINLCESNHESFCRSCFSSYIQNTISSAYMGTCPPISCPSEYHSKRSRSFNSSSSSQSTSQVSSYFGSSSPSSPSSYNVKRRKIIPFYKWKKITPQEINDKFTSLASSLLAFLCGGCHALKSLDVGYDSSKLGEVATKVLKAQEGSNIYNDYVKKIEDYSYGDLYLDEIYTYILKEFLPSNFISKPDSDAWAMFSLILQTIQDPERRANLHLRYLRDRPRIRTLCCLKEHCFSCKTKDFHEGKSCLEQISKLDNAIVPCPTCSLSLTKGDGCNTVTCLCGQQFSWVQEKEKNERCQEFLKIYPEDTNLACAKILCRDFVGEELLLARAWQARNFFNMKKALRSYFKEKFSPFPTQSCVILSRLSLPDGLRESLESWIEENDDEYKKRREENYLSIKKIVEIFCPNEDERVSFCYKIMTSSRRNYYRTSTTSSNLPAASGSTSTTSSTSSSSSSSLPAATGNISVTTSTSNTTFSYPPFPSSSFDRLLLLSSQLWIDANREKYNKELELLEINSAKQFLYLYGEKPIKRILPTKLSSPSSYEWSASLSNSDLTFTNNYSTVERIGSISCYPAAFSLLTAPRASFRVLIEQAPRSSNWLTFGLARRGMPSSSSDGVGRTSGSWGIADDRSSSSSSTLIASSGAEVGTCRKLQLGDVLCASVDLLEGWLEISLNEAELVHRFILPPGNMDDYYFAMTFANDHRVTILQDSAGTASFSSPYSSSLFSQPVSSAGTTVNNYNTASASSSPLPTQKFIDYSYTIPLNKEHSVMYGNLKKHLKSLATGFEESFLVSPTKLSTFCIFTSANNPSYISDQTSVPSPSYYYGATPNSSTSLSSSSSSTINSNSSTNSASKLLARDWIEWVDYCGSMEKAIEEYEKLKPSIDSFLGIRREGVKVAPSSCLTNPATGSDIGNLTFNQLLKALSFYSHQSSALWKEKKIHMANKFLLKNNNNESTPAIAALLWSEFVQVERKGGSTSNKKKEKEKDKEKEEILEIISYMENYYDKMNQWYDYDKELAEPLLENVVPECRCLPRHQYSCPFC